MTTELVTLELNGYKHYPYEERFAAREVSALLGRTPLRSGRSFVIEVVPEEIPKLLRLAYVERVVRADGSTLPTTQAVLERSVAVGGVPRKRQSTRYSSHGIHEYRGKFNPQVVRAIGNMIGVSPGAWVLDPFCGSGTTLLESLHMGWNAIGIDINPLAVLIANAKLDTWRVAVSDLAAAEEQLADLLSERVAGLTFESAWSEEALDRVGGPSWRSRVPNADYLSSWIPASSLAQLAAILIEIEKAIPPQLRRIFQVIVSDLVRDVSWQEPADLRVRRRKDAAPNYPVIPLFNTAMSKHLRMIRAARRDAEGPVGRQLAEEFDSRQPLSPVVHEVPAGTFDAVITSPPYATALPYIDTQRLSLCLLDLVRADAIRQLERDLTGSREISTAARRELSKELARGPEPLTPEIISLCRRMAELVDGGADGFRRQNVPTLTYRYFVDMARTFRSVRTATKVGAPFALVVGRNQTTLAGESITIDTPGLLARLAEADGWRLDEILPMETYQRFDLHATNSIRSESLVLLRRR